MIRSLAGALALLAAFTAAAAAGSTAVADPDARHRARSAPAARPDALLLAGRFGTVSVYIPEGTPRSVAIFVSGDGGWELGVVGMAQALREMGAVVIGTDIRRYLASLGRAARRAAAPCQSLAGDFEALSHEVQREIGMSEYHVPVLVGYSSGATLVYATLVESPPGTFAGALSLGFCPDQDFSGAALCPGTGLHYHANNSHELVLEPAATLRQPWIALQGQQDEVCSPRLAQEFAAQVAGGELVSLAHVGHGFGIERNWLPQFRAAYARLAAAAETPPARPPAISDLPVEEVRSPGSSEEFVLLLTGDGGWAGLDRELAARLAARGVPTVGFDSLKYFWSPRTPDETTRDVARVLRYYFAAWNKQRVLLVGYSFGADVLPFVVNRLPADLRARVASLSLLGIDSRASFEIHIAGWLGSSDGGPPTRPELEAVHAVPVLCIYGEDESDSICPGLPAATGIVRERVGRGHHFSGEYAALADRILTFARTGRPVT